MTRRKARPPRRQTLLFPRVEQGDAMQPEANKEIVTVLADLLLEALQNNARKGGGDDESEDNA